MTTITPRRRRMYSCAGLMLAVGITLTGCANPIEGMIESVGTKAADKLVSEATGVEVEGFGSTEIPADFPQGVPLPDATPHTALSHTDEGERSWIIHYQEGIDDQVFDQLVAALTANGFTEDSSSDMPNIMRIAVFTDSVHMVNLGLLGSADEEQILQLMVTTNTPG